MLTVSVNELAIRSCRLHCMMTCLRKLQIPEAMIGIGGSQYGAIARLAHLVD